MKKILSVFMTLVMMSGVLSVSAADVEFDWERDMDLFIEYNVEADMIEAIATIPSATNQKDQFSLGIFVDGREYRKFFKYSSVNSLLHVDFDIPQTLTDETTIFLSVKDAQYNEVYTNIPANYSFYNRNDSTNTTVRSEFGSAGYTKDYGVFSMWVSRSGASSTSRSSNYMRSDADDTNSRANVSDLTKAELVGSDEGQNVVEENNSMEEVHESSVSVEVSPEKKVFFPRYEKPCYEGRTINGIGNSNMYYEICGNK